MPTGCINIDYLSFTLRDYTSPSAIIALLGLEFAELQHGMRRYRRSMRGVGHPGLVLFEGSEPGMGVHFVLSGEVLRILERQEGFTTWAALLDTLRAVGATFTRVDLALDDLGGSLQWEHVKDAILDGHFSARVHSDSMKIHQSRHKGSWLSTLTLGSRQSERFFRCYQKCQARGDDFDGLRFELECKARFAEAAATSIIEGGFAAAAGMVSAFITFTDPESTDSTRCRRPAASWWREFVGALRHVVNVTQSASRCIQKRFAHLKKQYSQTFYVLTSLLGGSTDWAYDMITEGSQRVNRANRELIRFWEKQNYVPNLGGS